MSTPITAALSGSLQGATSLGALTPIPLSYVLEAQNAHDQKTVVVRPTDIVATKSTGFDPIAVQAPGSVQTMFALTSDLPVRFQLNGNAALTFEFFKSNGVYIMTGGPEITSVEFDGTSSSDAKVSITRILGS